MSLADAAPVAIAVMSQAISKLYDEWRAYIGTVPSINVTAISERAVLRWRDNNENTSLLRRLSAKETEALDDYLESVDFRNFAADYISIRIATKASVPSTYLHRQASKQLQIFGVVDLASNEASTSAILDLLSSIADELAPIDVDQILRSRRMEKEQAVEKAAALARIRDNYSTGMLDLVAAILDSLDGEVISAPRLEGKLSRLRTSTVRAHSLITPPNMDHAIRRPIADLYVPPTLKRSVLDSRGLAGKKFRVPEDLHEIFSHSLKHVVLGSPGAGKSTLAQFITWAVSSRSLNIRDANASIVIVLRELSDLISDAGLSVIDAVRHTMSTRYQVDVSSQEVSYLFATGRLLLIVDGLDELLDVSTRASVVSSLEAFSGLYHRAPLIVTSRSVGYNLAPLDQEHFRALDIAPFALEQIEAYASKWFSLDTDLTTLEAVRLTESFILESSGIDDLRTNPLLLSLLCGIYKHRHYLPRNKPAIYQLCSEMLFKNWDQNRKLRPKFAFDRRIDGAVQFLAYWIFQSESRSAGVAEEDLEQTVAEYLLNKMYTDQDAAEDAASMLIDHCRNRAWILSEIGAPGRRLFGFTHRTFLEYFTARHLVRTFTNDEIVALVSARGTQSEWNMVLQMVIQLASEKMDALEDRAALGLLQSSSSKEPSQREVALTVCVQTLFNTPLQPASVKTITDRTLRYYLNTRHRTSASDRTRAWGSFWVGSEGMAVENQAVAVERGSEVFNERLRHSDEAWQFNVLHAADFVSKNVDRFAQAHDFIRDDIKITIRNSLEKASRRLDAGAFRPALIASAFVLGVDVTAALTFAPAKGLDEFLFGSETGFNQLTSQFDLSPIPNASEIVIALTAEVGPSGASVFVKQLTPLVDALMSRFVRRKMNYGSVHPLFWSAVPDSGSRDDVFALVPEDLAAQLYLLALGLCECYVNSGSSQPLRERRVRELLGRDWGALTRIRALLRQRYNLDTVDWDRDEDWTVIGPVSDWRLGRLEASQLAKRLASPMLGGE